MSDLKSDINEDCIICDNLNVAVMLAMAYQLIVQDLHDGYFLDKYLLDLTSFKPIYSDKQMV